MNSIACPRWKSYSVTLKHRWKESGAIPGRTLAELWWGLWWTNLTPSLLSSPLQFSPPSVFLYPKELQKRSFCQNSKPYWHHNASSSPYQLVWDVLMQIQRVWSLCCDVTTHASYLSLSPLCQHTCFIDITTSSRARSSHWIVSNRKSAQTFYPI